MSTAATLLFVAIQQTPTVQLTVDVSHDVHSISPYIYGTNAPDWNGRTKYLTLSRSGGNRMTAYNWENNASNAGSDWFHQNDDFLGGGETPLGAVLPGANAALSRGKSTIVTVPMIGYVAADKNGGGDVGQTPNYLNVRFKRSYADSPLGTDWFGPPDKSDGAVYQDQFVGNMEVSRSPSAGKLWYSLDNEPDLWASTHARLQLTPLSYATLLARTVEYASAIKKVAPSTLVFGPVSYGWNGYQSLQNAPDANGRYFLQWYLQQMRVADANAGKRLLDVLDLHYYSEARGAGKRVTEDGTEPGLVTARVNSARSLYDPTYTEESWITQWSTQGPINLLPRMRSLIAAEYPDTKLAFTEYNFGGSDISSAIAQADALGAFGREGVFAACFWPIQSDTGFILGAFDMFRNFNGRGGAFGDTSVRATSSNLDRVSVWASKDSYGRRIVVVAINRSTSPTKVLLNVIGARPRSGEAYRLTSASTHPVRQYNYVLAGSRLPMTMPAMSVTTLVMK